MDYTQLIDRLRKAARHDSMFGDDVREHASEQAADAIEALQARVKELEEQVTVQHMVALRAAGAQAQPLTPEQIQQALGLVYPPRAALILDVRAIEKAHGIGGSV